VAVDGPAGRAGRGDGDAVLDGDLVGVGADGDRGGWIGAYRKDGYEWLIPRAGR
jgi:hypothetical protein